MKGYGLIGLMAIVLAAGCGHRIDNESNKLRAEERHRRQMETRIRSSLKYDVANYAQSKDLGVQISISEIDILEEIQGYVAVIKWRARKYDAKVPRAYVVRSYQSRLSYDTHGKFTGSVTDTVVVEP